MSVPSSVPRLRRVKPKLDYASINRKGLQSVKTIKTKTKIKGRKVVKKTPATPSSGDWRVELLKKYEHDETGEGAVECEGSKKDNGSVKQCDTDPNCLQSKVPELGFNGFPPQSPLAHDSSDIIHLVLQKSMSREDKKKALRESIAQLKRQLQEKEEDEELCALMQEEEKLRAQLG